MRSLRTFLADHAARDTWLKAEMEDLEKHDAHLAYWDKSGQHLGLVISAGLRSGEMHVSSDGAVTFQVERGAGEVIRKGSSVISDERGLKILYAEFRAAVLGSGS